MNREGPGINPTHDLWVNNKGFGKMESILLRLLRNTLFKQCVRQKLQSLFLYVPYNAPHYPMHAPQKYMDRFADLPWDRQVMAAMVSAVDDGIGEILMN